MYMIVLYCFRLLNVKCEKNIGLCERIDNRTADLNRITEGVENQVKQESLITSI
jgi:hypothetical protein